MLRQQLSNQLHPKLMTRFIGSRNDDGLSAFEMDEESASKKTCCTAGCLQEPWQECHQIDAQAASSCYPVDGAWPGLMNLMDGAWLGTIQRLAKRMQDQAASDKWWFQPSNTISGRNWENCKGHCRVRREGSTKGGLGWVTILNPNTKPMAKVDQEQLSPISKVILKNKITAFNTGFCKIKWNLELQL